MLHFAIIREQLHNSKIEQALRESSIQFNGLDNGIIKIPLEKNQTFLYVSQFLLNDLFVDAKRLDVHGGSGYIAKKYVPPTTITIQHAYEI